MRRKTAPVVWLILDAAADWAVRRLLNEGAMPALAQVYARGVGAGARPPALNCQTPPSLATLVTGVWPWQHGIQGYSVPSREAQQPITERRTGFSRELLQREPIWTVAGRQEKTYAMSHVPWVLSLDDEVLPLGCLFAVEGYSRCLSRGGVVLLSQLPTIADGRQKLVIGPVKLLVERKEKAMGVQLCSEQMGESWPLYESEQWKPFQIDTNGLLLRLWRRPSDGEWIILHSGIWQIRTAPSVEKTEFFNIVGPFVGEGLGSAYRLGMFGPRLVEGGDGTAEQLFVESIAQMATYFRRSSLNVVNRYPGADLYMFYQPCIDDVAHEVIGWCDPQSKAYQSKIADRVWEVVKQVYRMADQHLADLLTHFGEASTIIVSSDHGMMGMTHRCYVNEALAHAGLFAFDSQGGVDLARTKILYHPANNGSLWVNEKMYAGGIVRSEERDEIVHHAIVVLKELHLEESGAVVLQEIYPADSEENAGWMPEMGDLFVVAADGFEFSADRSPNGQVLVQTLKSANHATNSGSASLCGIFYAKGLGIAEGRDVGIVDNRDVFPLVCKQLGIEPPSGLEGKISPGVLEQPKGLEGDAECDTH